MTDRSGAYNMGVFLGAVNIGGTPGRDAVSPDDTEVRMLHVLASSRGDVPLEVLKEMSRLSWPEFTKMASKLVKEEAITLTTRDGIEYAVITPVGDAKVKKS